MTSPKTDPVLQKAVRGDREAFTLLVENHYDFAFRVAFRMMADEDDARDIVQEAFLRVWNRITSFRTHAKFSTWLYTIVSHLCIDSLRKQKNHADIPAEEVLEKIIHTEDERLDNSDLASIIRIIAGKLSPKQRLVFVLRDLEGLDMKEIAEITKLSDANVKSNLWHARKNIREKLIRDYKVEH